MIVPLAELEELLPVCRKLALDPSAPGALRQPQRPEAFVAPLMERSGQTPPSAVPIIVVSAAGAVGKSTLASHLAHSHATVLWDLSKMLIGDNTFMGTVARAFGPHSTSQVLSDLASGKALFVIDAFDEAELLSGWAQVEQFVEDAFHFCSTSSIPSLVFLARTETAILLDRVLRRLAGRGPARHAEYRIGFFDEPGSKRFVAMQLGVIHKQDSAQRHPKPFDEALDQMFRALARALDCDEDEPWKSPDGARFLGYAPVLQAVSTFLSQYPNFHEAAQFIEESAARAPRDALLANILHQLLLREQQKFLEPLKDQRPLDAEEPNWVELYCPSEQLKRVLGIVLGDPDASRPTEGMPAWLQPIVEANLKSFVQNHPFLRGKAFAGPAFREYALGFTLLQDDYSVFAETLLEGGEFVPTGLLADFYLTTAELPGSARHAGYLYESVAARFGHDSTTLGVSIGPETGNGVHLLTLSDEVGEFENSGYAFYLRVGDGEPLTFRRRLRNATIHLSGKLLLGLGRGSFDVENSEIEAADLEIAATAFTAHFANKNDIVLIAAKRYSEQGQQIRVTVIGEGVFKVCWPNSDHYPWAQYRDDALFAEPLDRQGAQVALRRILKWFRRDGRQDHAKLADFILGIVGNNDVRTKLLSFLLEKNVLQREGRMFTLNLPEARRYSLNWTDLHRAYPPKTLIPFLDEFLEWSRR